MQRIDLTPERYESYLNDPDGLRALLQDTANTSGQRYDVYSPDEVLLFSVRPGEDADLNDLLRQMETELDIVPIGLPRDEAVEAVESLPEDTRLIRGAELQLEDLRAMEDGDLVWVQWQEGAELEPLVDSPLPIRFGPNKSFVVIGERFIFLPEVYDLDDDDHCVADGWLRREEHAQPGSLELYHAARTRTIDVNGILSDPAETREVVILGLMALYAREGVEADYATVAAAYDAARSTS